jgi:hypothetical protein
MVFSWVSGVGLEPQSLMSASTQKRDPAVAAPSSPVPLMKLPDRDSEPVVFP